MLAVHVDRGLEGGIPQKNAARSGAARVEGSRSVVHSRPARAAHVSLLTLVGPPGSGKTALALMAAQAAADLFTDGIWFVDLTPIQDPALVGQAIAATLDITDASGGDLTETLQRVLRTRDALLILDNFEQVLSAAATVRFLLERCPRLKILATSRAALNLSSEQQFLVSPLEVPDLSAPLELDEIERNPCVALFKLRAQAVNPAWDLSIEEAPAVAELCVRLDGLPLAIELAASWTRLLPARAILRRLGKALDLLVASVWDQPERHHTLRAAIKWSEELLSAEQKTLFRRLAVFSGGFTLEAAAAVCQPADGAPPDDLLQGLALLADHHLLFSVAQSDGEPRFGMLATIREYALERLGACGELDAARLQQARYFLRLVAEAERAYHGPGQSEWLDRIETEYDNFRAVLEWGVHQSEAELKCLGLRVGSSLWFFWTVRGHIKEGRERLAGLLDWGRAQTPARAKALVAAGWLAWFNSDAVAALPFLEESLQIYRALGDEPGIARALGVMGLCLAVYTDEFARARHVLDEATGLSRTVGDPWSMGFSAYGLGHLAARLGTTGAPGPPSRIHWPFVRRQAISGAWPTHSTG